MLRKLIQTSKHIYSRSAKSRIDFQSTIQGVNPFRAVVDNQRWFVKHGNTPQTVTWLKQAVRFHAAVQHEALPRLHNAFVTSDGFALVYNWVDGEGLRPERELGPNEVHPRDRFCALPASEIIDALNVIFDVHILIEKEGSSLKTFTMAALFMTLRKSGYICSISITIIWNRS